MLWPRRVLLMYQTSHEISYLYKRNSAPQDRGKQRPLRDGPIGPGPPARPALTTHPQLLVYAATTRRCIAASFGNCIGVGKSEGDLLHQLMVSSPTPGRGLRYDAC